MSDWYMSLFGRPSPGRRARDRRFRYIDGAEDPQVSNQSDAVDHARGYEPPDSPQWARDVSQNRAQQRRAAREEDIDLNRPILRNPDGTISTEETITIEAEGRFVNIPTIVGGARRSEEEAVQLWRQGFNRDVGSYDTLDQAEYDARERSIRIGELRGDSQGRVPLSALTGDDAPFGDDFVVWYEATHGRPLPRALRADTPAEPAPEEPGRKPNNPNNIPLGVEGGTRALPTRLERGTADRAPVVERTFAPIEGDLYDETRQAGIAPDFDATREWAAAERRAYERARSGRPSPWDMVFAAIYGRGQTSPSRQRE